MRNFFFGCICLKDWSMAADRCDYNGGHGDTGRKGYA